MAGEPDCNLPRPQALAAFLDRRVAFSGQKVSRARLSRQVGVKQQVRLDVVPQAMDLVVIGVEPAHHYPMVVDELLQAFRVIRQTGYSLIVRYAEEPVDVPEMDAADVLRAHPAVVHLQVAFLLHERSSRPAQDL